MKLRALLALAGALLFAMPAAAQTAPDKPRLPRDADPNDWEAYFALGEQKFLRQPGDAYAAFYWASRLDPTRPEPPLAMWASFYAHDHEAWIQYLTGDREVLRRPDVLRNEQLLSTAYHRNPFVHRGLEVGLYLALGDQLAWGKDLSAFTAYARGDFPGAARRFGAIVRDNPRRNVRFRHFRALSFVSGGEPDSAAAEIQVLLGALREQDQAEVVYFYESKDYWEYALGRIYEAQGKAAEAREAYQRALVEDMTMYPAHAGLARLDMQAGALEEAVAHAGAGVETSRDGVMVFEYANALAAAGHLDAAITAYGQAIELEPHWADPYLRLGLMHDYTGEPQKAVAAYRAFLERAPRRSANAITAARQRIAELAP